MSLETKFAFKNALYAGVCIFLGVMVIYYAWVHFIFRYSPDRIGAKLSNIYTNSDINPRTQYAKHSRQHMSPDKSVAYATMSITDMLTGVVVSSELFSAKNRPDCTSLDTDCVNL